MARIWEHNPWYRFWRHYVDFCTRSCFSSVRIEGIGNLPENGAVMLAPNHCAALMDALLVLLLKKDTIGFGARADIFRNPRIASILRWLRILPIARERDGLREVASNHDTFNEIIDCLDHEVPFCMFSEGTHRTERGMMPVRKGIFRICKMASERLGKPVRIVPVGLYYEYFFRQMGRVVIRVGEPFEIGEYFRKHEGLAEADIYRSLCDELKGRILPMIEGIPDRRRGLLVPRALLSLLSLPVFIACSAASFPLWLTALLLSGKMADKAWTHTIWFGCKLLLPVFLPFHWMASYLLHTYKNLINDLKK